MLHTGDIDANYIDAMQKVIEELGPYSVVAPGVVLLHAKPEDGVKNISFVLATLENGINFGSKNDPVFLAIGLGAIDHNSHIELLQDLSVLLQDRQILDTLVSYEKEDVAKAITLINNYKRKIFSE